jgi:hypothetical protein
VQVYVPATRPEAVAAVPPLGDQEYVYAPVPPPALHVAVPLFPPQVVFVAVEAAVTAPGSVITTEAPMEQPFASVIVQLYEPAVSPLAEFVELVFGVQEYVYPAVPPDTVTVPVPFAPPLQLTFVWAIVKASAGGWVMVKVCVRIHPLASVIVQVYVPADRLEAVAPVPPLGDQEYV